MPSSCGSGLADETSIEGTARHLGIADAAPARKNMEEAAVGVNPGKALPRQAEASDNPGEAPLRPANWGQMTWEAKKGRKQRQRKERKEP